MVGDVGLTIIEITALCYIDFTDLSGRIAGLWRK